MAAARKTGTKMDAWSVETWTNTCGLPLLFHVEPHPTHAALPPCEWRKPPLDPALQAPASYWSSQALSGSQKKQIRTIAGELAALKPL